MHLSVGSRRAYSECQDVLEDVRTSGARQDDLSDDHYDIARRACSNFRTWLTPDLLSRSRAPTGVRGTPILDNQC